jgi:hypothetical protein
MTDRQLPHPYIGPPKRFVEGIVEWRFGAGTRNLGGDYWVEGLYREPSIFTAEHFLDLPQIYTEDLTYCVDEDLLMDEGL